MDEAIQVFSTQLEAEKNLRKHKETEAMLVMNAI
jgi:hypothetical protein